MGKEVDVDRGAAYAAGAAPVEQGGAGGARDDWVRPGLVRTLGTLLERAGVRRRGGERGVCAAANPEQFTSCVVCSAERPAIGQSEDT